jgi:hypothetical protein
VEIGKVGVHVARSHCLVLPLRQADGIESRAIAASRWLLSGPEYHAEDDSVQEGCC